MIKWFLQRVRRRRIKRSRRRYSKKLDRQEKEFVKRDWGEDLREPCSGEPQMKVKTRRLLQDGDVVRGPSGIRYLVSRRGWRRLGAEVEESSSERESNG